MLNTDTVDMASRRKRPGQSNREWIQEQWFIGVVLGLVVFVITVVVSVWSFS